MKYRALVVDDDAGVRYTLAEILGDTGLTVDVAENVQQAIEMAQSSHFDLVITDLRMTPLDGLDLLRILHAEQPKLKIIMVTAHGSERHAVEAIKLGAYDYFRKPFDLDELMAAVGRALESLHLVAENERLTSESNFAQSLVFRSASMSRLAVLVSRVGPRDVTVLINGESGTGKERVAEAIVRASTRAERPFIRFNCATLTAELAEAELFGHVKGAFTGAQRNRSGLFREAHGGTLLLDEIGELDLNLQAKLLRALQEGEVRPVGEDRSYAVDVRIIAATHRDLVECVKTGQFRDDLYYRLKVVSLTVPSLRERPEDIPVLARHFLQRVAERFGTGPLHVPPELFERLSAYDWPGNVRELENAVEALVALSIDGELDLSLLPGQPGKPMPATMHADDSNAQALTFKQRVEAYERGLIVTALEVTGGNRRETALRLGLSRATLHDKLHRYGLAVRGDDD